MMAFGKNTAGGQGGGIADRINSFRQMQDMRGRGTRGPVATPQRPPRAGPVAPQGALRNMYGQAQAQAGGAPPPQAGGMPGRVMANQRAMAQQMRGGGKPMPGPGMIGRRPPNPTGSRMGGGGYGGGGRRGPMRMGRGDMYR